MVGGTQKVPRRSRKETGLLTKGVLSCVRQVGGSYRKVIVWLGSLKFLNQLVSIVSRPS